MVIYFWLDKWFQCILVLEAHHGFLPSLRKELITRKQNLDGTYPRYSIKNQDRLVVVWLSQELLAVFTGRWSFAWFECWIASVIPTRRRVCWWLAGGESSDIVTMQWLTVVCIIKKIVTMATNPNYSPASIVAANRLFQVRCQSQSEAYSQPGCSKPGACPNEMRALYSCCNSSYVSGRSVWMPDPRDLSTWRLLVNFNLDWKPFLPKNVTTPLEIFQDA